MVNVPFFVRSSIIISATVYASHTHQEVHQDDWYENEEQTVNGVRHALVVQRRIVQENCVKLHLAEHHHSRLKNAYANRSEIFLLTGKNKDMHSKRVANECCHRSWKFRLFLLKRTGLYSCKYLAVNILHFQLMQVKTDHVHNTYWCLYCVT